MIRLHHVPQSRSRRVLWLLEEIGADYARVDHPFDRSLRAPDYLALSPAGRVPALEIDGLVMWESGAIVEYLCERFPEAGLGRAPAHPERARWLVWIHFAETVSQHVAALTQQHVVLREDAMRSPTVMTLEAMRLRKCYAAVEAHLSGDHLLPSGFSAADICVGQAVDMGRRFARLEAVPKTRAWMDRLTARPAWARALDGDGVAPIYDRDFYDPWAS